ncbi:cytochrome P450 [Aspergillus heterothallicus]
MLSLILIPLVMAIIFVVVPTPLFKNLPPGPRLPPPIWSNRKDLARELGKWHKTHGPIVAHQFGSRVFISLGSFEAIRELLCERAENYAPRPFSVVGKYFTQDYHPALLRDPKRAEAYDRILWALLQETDALQRHEELEHAESMRLMQTLLRSRGMDLSTVLHRHAYSLTWALGFGDRLLSTDDERYREIARIRAQLKHASEFPIVSHIEMLPILDRIPFAFAPWKWIGYIHFVQSSSFYNKYAEEALEKRGWNWIKAARKFNCDQELGLSDTEIAFLIGSLVEMSTINAEILGNCILAAVTHSDAVKKAKQELDEVVGTERLPAIEDEPYLPIVRVFVYEVLRWKPVTALGVPQLASADDEYMGYTIPKGSTILVSGQAATHDNTKFEDPDSFRPERWLEILAHPQADLGSLSFAFDELVSTTQLLTGPSLMLNVARILWGFDLEHAGGIEISEAIPLEGWLGPRSAKHCRVFEHLDIKARRR